MLSAGASLLAAAALALLLYGTFSPRYDSDYAGAATCGECHTGIYPRWQGSPHANMTRRTSQQSVVGDFDRHEWFLPATARRGPLDERPVARMYREGEHWFMALRQPGGDAFVAYPIEYVIGYQYRQVYLTREPGGVLRRLPLQWSVKRQEYFPYWNLQEGSTPSAADFAAQMRSLNSAWNLFCARCHTTHLTILDKDPGHTRARTAWVDDGIACEACHGPGSSHVEYFRSGYFKRIASWVASKFAGHPVAYIASADKLDKGQAMSVCARCHGSDILMSVTDVYRTYEPGYSREGRTNDISRHFRSTPLTPGRPNPTVETYADGEPKGIGMLFRSLIESSCYQQAEIRCYDCHDPHQNKLPAAPGLLQPSAASNDYCLGCHRQLEADPMAHSGHQPGTPGSFCYDCHLPKIITKLGGGELEYARTHRFSYLPESALDSRPNPGIAASPCRQCHDPDHLSAGP